MTLKVDIHKDCRVKIDFTMAGYHWIMHNHDDDINAPSCPHCHATDSPGVYKLNIYTGEYFEYPGEKYKGKISKQEMKFTCDYYIDDRVIDIKEIEELFV